MDHRKEVKKKDRRNTIYESVINNRTTKALREKEREFEELHREDDDKALLEYVLREALILGHTPGKKEIVGWSYLVSRFGSWDSMLAKAHLKKSRGASSAGDLTLRMEETERQKALYRERKQEKKIKAQRRLKQQKEK